MSLYLLDTHVLLWLLADPDRLTSPTRSLLADPLNTLLVSAASAMEVATKTRLGKISAEQIVTSWAARVASITATHLPITAEHAILAGTLSWEHRDPFDRLLVAQAILENATLATADAAVQRFAQVAVLPC